MFNCHLKYLSKDYAVIWHNKKLTRYGNRYGERTMGCKLVSLKANIDYWRNDHNSLFSYKATKNLQFIKNGG